MARIFGLKLHTFKMLRVRLSLDLVLRDLALEVVHGFWSDEVVVAMEYGVAGCNSGLDHLVFFSFIDSHLLHFGSPCDSSITKDAI